MNWWMKERGDPLFAHSERTTSLLKTMIRFVVRNQIILAQGEWSGEKDKNNPRRMQEKIVKSILWCGTMFMSSKLQASAFMVNNYSDNWHSIKNSKDLTLKQMFDTSARWVSEQNEISGLETIVWENHSWTFLSLTGGESVFHLHRTKVYVFSDSVSCLGKIHENPRANTAWEERWAWFKCSPEYRTLGRIDGEPIEFEWKIFTGVTTLQLSHKVLELLLRIGETPVNFSGRIIFMTMFSDISWRSKDNKKDWESNAKLVALFAKRFGAGHFSVLVQRKSGTLPVKTVHKENGTKLLRRWWWHSQKADTQVFRATSRGNLSIHYCADQDTITTVFHTITSVNQLSLDGAVAEMWWRIWILSRGKTRCGRTVEFLVRAKCDQHKRAFEQWWSYTLRITTAKIRRANWKVITTRQIEQILYGFRISDRCWNRTVFHDERHWIFSYNSQIQSPVVSTLCQGTKIHLNRRVGSEGTPKLGPYWKLQPVVCTVSTELRSELCLWTENSLSWVRISHDLNKLFTNLNNNEQDTSEM